MLLSTLELFHSAAKKTGLDYLIIGGLAVSHWGKLRFTADIDFVICTDTYGLGESVFEKIDYELQFLHPKGSFAHFRGKDFTQPRIDLMIVDAATWGKLSDASSLVDFGEGEAKPCVSPIHLIAMKLHSAKQPDRKEKTKDLLDVVEIMINQKISFEQLKHLGIIAKHGSEETTDFIRTELSKRNPA